MALPEIEDWRERQCIAIRKSHTILYLYPFDMEVAENGARVMTRDGRTVRKVRVSYDEKRDCHVVTGILNDAVVTWDKAGRYRSPYLNHDNDLYIAERYFDPDWEDKIHLSHRKWNELYQRHHPYCKAPKIKDPLSKVNYSQIKHPQYNNEESE